MSEITLIDSQTYLLPLDSLDLTCLSKYVRSSNDKLSPIWSQQRLKGESEYFHVKIAAQKIDEEDCYFEPLDTYTCHICNLDVPKTCYKQHNESNQHETYKKICEKLLERVAKQINIINIDNDWDDTKNLYYCAPCSRAVNLKNKHQHESSDYHKKSEENMSIINDFYKKIIEDGTRIPNGQSHDESNSESDESETEDTQHYTVNNNLEQIPNIRNDLQKDIDSEDECLNITSISNKNKEIFAIIHELQAVSQSESTELCNRITLEQNQPFDSYFKEIISKYKLDVSTPVTDGEYIIIVSPNGDKVKISREHFHSYKHVNKRVYCQVCKMWIFQNTKPHEVTEIHVRNIFKIVNEKYARMMDTVYSHCLICNEVILTESDHQNISDDHKNILFDAKIQQNIENIDHKTLCEICNIYINTQDLKSHNILMEHNKEANTGMLKYNNIVKINGSDCFSNGCKMNLDSNALNKTINNRTHIDKMIFPNVITNAEYCEICKVEISQGVMKAHSFTECFKDVIIKAVSDVIKDESIFNNIANCLAKNEEFKNVFQKYDTYQNKLSLTDTAQNESLTSQNKTTLHSTVTSHMYEHMEGALHEKEVKELLHFHGLKKDGNIYKCYCCKVNVTDNFDHINSDKHTNKFLEKYMIDKKLIRKYVYEDTSTHGGEAIQYRELYRNLLRSNDISELSNSRFYCGICCIKLSRISEIDHVLGDKHLSVKQNKLQ